MSVVVRWFLCTDLPWFAHCFIKGSLQRAIQVWCLNAILEYIFFVLCSCVELSDTHWRSIQMVLTDTWSCHRVWGCWVHTWLSLRMSHCHIDLHWLVCKWISMINWHQETQNISGSVSTKHVFALAVPIFKTFSRKKKSWQTFLPECSDSFKFNSIQLLEQSH